MNAYKGILFTLLFTPLISYGQNHSVGVKKTADKILIDGVLSENVWTEAEVITNFTKNFPTDTGLAESRTEVFLTYNNDYLYVAAICYDDVPGKYIVQSLKRDFSFPRTDAFAIFLDTYSDGTNGFSFGVSAVGSQREGTIETGGRWGVGTAWDNKWESEVTTFDDRWVLEMAIPFKSIRFKDGIKSWKINFARNDQKRNEQSTWSPVPINNNVADLAFTGELIWEDPPTKKGGTVSIIPYISGGLNKDYENNQDLNTLGNVGMDAKIGITSGLNLDLTINPDFSQVDVDRQVLNISRFEISFPERRQFFIENSDLFGNMGSWRSRPFFSRRVGLVYNDSTDLYESVPILFGTRLSGKLNQNWRIGVMSIQTGRKNEIDIKQASQNFSMASVQRKVFKRSSIDFFIVNRQAFGTDSTKEIKLNEEDYNRVVGSEFKYLSKSGRWNGVAYYHRSFDKVQLGDNDATGAYFRYNHNRVEIEMENQYVGENYNPEVGFVTRTGYFKNWTKVGLRTFPKSEKIIRYSMHAAGEHIIGINQQLIQSNYQAYFNIRFINNSYIHTGISTSYIKLEDDFDPSGTDGPLLSAGTDYRTTGAWLFFHSDERDALYVWGTASWGEYYTGDKFNLKGGVRWRVGYKANIYINGNFNNINLPNPQNNSQLMLIGPGFNYSFTTKLSFSSIIQYNNQIDNVNINARLQWRFKPASDLFIVYSENYFANDFAAKSRALVVKLTYWLNI